ncbi:MAG: ATP-binding protein [Muribaculaceae bacterium]|nr:ATP-binding protein [Muribaculaceae bacterium]
MKIIPRRHYLAKIEHYFNRDTLIILTGQRRVGKSYMLRSLKAMLEADSSNHIIFIDKEKRTFDGITDYTELNSYIDANLRPGNKNYILIDEVQNIDEFEKSLRAYYEEENIEIIVTGSNSKMLSTELSTLIGGRYKEIYIQSLTYAEFLEFHNLEDSEDTISKYLIFGGLPGLLRTGLNEDDALEYQSDVLSTVLLKDVVMRNKIRNVQFLNNLVSYLADNTGKLISASNISKYMKAQDNTISAGLILNYLEYLQESYTIKKVVRYDIHGKRLFESNDKYYFQDLGIRNSLLRAKRALDIEKAIENSVYNHLIYLGYEVTVGQLNGKEIDFVAQRSGHDPVYIQVAYLIAGDETYRREFGNLKEIKNNYPKYVISLTPLLDSATDEGIKHISLRSFLLRSAPL